MAPEEIVVQLLQGLSERDLDACTALLDVDAVVLDPFESGLSPARVEGVAAIRESWSTVLSAFEQITFVLDGPVLVDGDRSAVARFSAAGYLVGGADYRMRYVGWFTFTPDGLIASYAEYFDTLGAALAFGFAERTALGEQLGLA